MEIYVVTLYALEPVVTATFNADDVRLAFKVGLALSTAISSSLQLTALTRLKCQLVKPGACSRSNSNQVLICFQVESVMRGTSVCLTDILGSIVIGHRESMAV